MLRQLALPRGRIAAFVLALAFAPLSPAPAPAQEEAPRLDVPYVQTPQSVVDRMLSMAGVTADDYVVDFGSGDGRMPITAAQRHGARGLGIDLNPARVAEAQQNAKTAGVADRVQFRQGDLYETEFDPDATVLTMYLLPRINLDLRPRILNQLRPGTRVVSHAFTMGDWQPDQTEKIDNRDVYLWVVPARVDGRWTVKAGESEMPLLLTQQFQKVQGAMRMNGRWHTLQDAKLQGDEISFAVRTGDNRTLRFVGQVRGEAIQGQPAVGAEAWSAQRPFS